MQNPSKTKATYQDLLAVPDNLVAQIIDGELITMPRPASPHAWTSSALGGLLNGPFMRGKGGPGGWIIVNEPELHIGDDILVPDIAGWRKEKMTSYPNIPYFSLVPDWVCEVLSPSTARIDRIKKMPIYAAEGVNFIWLIHPLDKTLEAYRLERGSFPHQPAQWILIGTLGEKDKVHVPPFQEFELELEWLWSEYYGLVEEVQQEPHHQ